MKYLIAAFLLAFSFSSHAQFNVVKLPAFDTTSKACANNPGKKIITFKQWEGYQTLNNKWDGPRDTSACFNIARNNYDPSIDFAEVQNDKAVFIRAMLNDSNKIALDSNELYHYRVYFYFPSELIGKIDTSANCPDNVCSGVLIGIQIPADSGKGTAMRWYPAKLNSITQEVNLCISTERFPKGNFLREIIYILKPLQSLSIGRASIYNYYGFQYSRFKLLQIRKIEAPLVGNKYIFDPRNLPVQSWKNNLLLMYNDSTYPSAQNLSFVEVQPTPNTVEVQNVEILLNYDYTLNSQPFVRLRGAKTLADSTRHNFTIINKGGDLCWKQDFVEVLLFNGDSYIHRSGNIEFEGKSSCFMLGHGGKLHVDDNSYLMYGRGGSGVLALKTGALLEIGRNATLEIGNTVQMLEFPWEKEAQQIYMSLDKGATLRFVKGAKLSNKYSKDKTMMLNVYMNGGVLDDSGLSDEDRKLIRRLAPNIASGAKRLQAAENPFNENLNFYYASAAAGALNIQLYNSLGQQIKNENLNLEPGNNAISLNATDIKSGLYILKTTDSAGNSESIKLIKN